MYTWNNAGFSATDTSWLSPGNWTGAVPFHYPGRVTATNTGNGLTDDIASFSSTLPTNSPVAVGINMGAAGTPAVLQLGAIQFVNESSSLLIGNSSTTASGTLQLNGSPVSIAGTQVGNVILYNGRSSSSLTIQGTVVSGGQSMGLALNVGNGIINTNIGSTINIATVISETGGSNGITHSGQGTLVLSGANTYSGGTTVSEGTLRTANTAGSATGSGPVTVASGATLSGTGTIIPDTGTPANNTVTANGKVRPGTDSATGYLTVGSGSAAATVSVGGNFSWSLSNAGASSTTSGGSDTNDPNNQSRLVVNGSLTFNPTTMDIVGLSGLAFDNTQSYSWRIASATNGVTIGGQPTFNATGLNAGSGSFTLSSGIGGVFLSFSPVPEPTTILITSAAVSSGMALIWQRIRRRSRDPQS
jgi:autotransporter-associated beta strand protein